LAELLASKGTKEDVDRALAMLGNVDGRPSSNDAAESRDDQRLLARVLTRQKTLEGRQRAMAILEKLVASEPDNTEDRFLLAQLKDVSGDWPEAHKQYKELIARVKSRQRLVRVIPEFVNRLIEHHENGQSEDLTEAQELVDLLVQMRPDELDPLTLEVKLNRVQNQLVNATALIKKYADRPQVQAATLSSLAGLAEGLVQDLPTVAFTANLKEGSSTVTDVSSMTGVSVGQLVTGPDIPAGTTIASLDSPTSITLSTAAKGTGSRSLNAIDPAAQGAYDLAEQIHQRIAKLDNFRGTLGQVGFLGRRGRVTEALDLCEPLWQIAREPAQVVGLAVAVVRVVLGSSNSVDPSQIKRAIDWLNQASAQNPQLAVLLTMLGNLKESQGSYSEAEGLYRRSIDQGDDGGIASNNLAWLLALKDGKVKEALEHVNRAINLRGPRPDFLDTRGVIEFIGDDNDNAIKDLKAAIAVDPSPAKYFHLAQVYSKIGKIDDAKTNLEAAKVKGYKQSGLHELEQEAYEKLRRNLGMK
jgi:tetratricopeptide (TPR) repeat protein